MSRMRAPAAAPNPSACGAAHAKANATEPSPAASTPSAKAGRKIALPNCSIATNGIIVPKPRVAPASHDYSENESEKSGREDSEQIQEPTAGERREVTVGFKPALGGGTRA